MGGEVVRKKQSEGERRWELGESEEERVGEGEGGGKRWYGCDLAVALGVKRAAANKIAVALFWHTRYC
jgi:hypothetical protein